MDWVLNQFFKKQVKSCLVYLIQWILVNMILGMEEPNYNIGDMDQDGALTVLDVVLLINTILDN